MKGGNRDREGEKENGGSRKAAKKGNHSFFQEKVVLCGLA